MSEGIFSLPFGMSGSGTRRNFLLPKKGKFLKPKIANIVTTLVCAHRFLID